VLPLFADAVAITRNVSDVAEDDIVMLTCFANYSKAGRGKLTPSVSLDVNGDRLKLTTIWNAHEVIGTGSIRASPRTFGPGQCTVEFFLPDNVVDKHFAKNFVNISNTMPAVPVMCKFTTTSV